MFPRIYLVPFCSSQRVFFIKFAFQEKRVLSFAQLDKWNMNNSIEIVKVFFSIVL